MAREEGVRILANYVPENDHLSQSIIVVRVSGVWGRQGTLKKWMCPDGSKRSSRYTHKRHRVVLK